MFQIHPFTAFRPIPAKSAQIISDAEAAALEFERLKSEKLIVQDEQPRMYIYRQARAKEKYFSLIAAMEMSPTIFVKLSHLQDYDQQVASQTWQRDFKLKAHVEIPVMAFEECDELLDEMQGVANARPLTHFLGKDGATHSVWACQDAARLAQLVGQLQSLVVLSGAEMLARDTHSQGATPALRAVAFTPIQRVTASASHILVSGGDGALLKKNVLHLQESIVESSEQEMGQPPSGFFDTYMASAPELKTGTNSLAGRWTRRRLPLPKLGDSKAANWERTRFERAFLTPWTQASADTPLQIQSLHSGFTRAQLAQYVDSAQAHAAFVFAPTSMQDLLDIVRDHERIPRNAASFSARIPSGLFIQSIA